MIRRSLNALDTCGVNPHRGRVMHWYRKMLRAAFTVDWNSDEDAAYVLNETRRLFRRNQDITDVDRIERKLDEAEQRYELAVHYRIPYPRMFCKSHNAATHSGVPYASYLDSAFDGQEANPNLRPMVPGETNSSSAFATRGSGLGYGDFNGDCDLDRRGRNESHHD